ncbi:hypothetical protein H8356DRAFT_1360571 [Neocallimastix lanati (nom. inval.)]|nr:hypothetical protein H8356DRAFT_1360571 [Neocallimastix sp. JGI-2020a]
MEITFFESIRFLVRPLPMPIAWLGFSGKYYTHLIPPISLIQLSSIYTSCRPERVECVWQSFLRGDTQHMVTYENLLILTYRYVMERLSRDPGDYYRTMTSSNYTWSNCKAIRALVINHCVSTRCTAGEKSCYGR